jgi:hypothetical protein
MAVVGLASAYTGMDDIEDLDTYECGVMELRGAFSLTR